MKNLMRALFIYGIASALIAWVGLLAINIVALTISFAAMIPVRESWQDAVGGFLLLALLLLILFGLYTLGGALGGALGGGGAAGTGVSGMLKGGAKKAATMGLPKGAGKEMLSKLVKLDPKALRNAANFADLAGKNKTARRLRSVSNLRSGLDELKSLGEKGNTGKKVLDSGKGNGKGKDPDSKKNEFLKKKKESIEKSLKDKKVREDVKRSFTLDKDGKKLTGDDLEEGRNQAKQFERDLNKIEEFRNKYPELAKDTNAVFLDEFLNGDMDTKTKQALGLHTKEAEDAREQIEKRAQDLDEWSDTRDVFQSGRGHEVPRSLRIASVGGNPEEHSDPALSDSEETKNAKEKTAERDNVSEKVSKSIDGARETESEAMKDVPGEGSMQTQKTLSQTVNEMKTAILNSGNPTATSANISDPEKEAKIAAGVEPLEVSKETADSRAKSLTENLERTNRSYPGMPEGTTLDDEGNSMRESELERDENGQAVSSIENDEIQRAAENASSNPGRGTVVPRSVTDSGDISEDNIRKETYGNVEQYKSGMSDPSIADEAIAEEEATRDQSESNNVDRFVGGESAPESNSSSQDYINAVENEREGVVAGTSRAENTTATPMANNVDKPVARTNADSAPTQSDRSDVSPAVDTSAFTGEKRTESTLDTESSSSPVTTAGSSPVAASASDVTTGMQENAATSGETTNVDNFLGNDSTQSNVTSDGFVNAVQNNQEAVAADQRPAAVNRNVVGAPETENTVANANAQSVRDQGQRGDEGAQASATDTSAFVGRSQEQSTVNTTSVPSNAPQESFRTNSEQAGANGQFQQENVDVQAQPATQQTTNDTYVNESRIGSDNLTSGSIMDSVNAPQQETVSRVAEQPVANAQEQRPASADFGSQGYVDSAVPGNSNRDNFSVNGQQGGENFDSQPSQQAPRVVQQPSQPAPQQYQTEQQAPQQGSAYDNTSQFLGNDNVESNFNGQDFQNATRTTEFVNTNNDRNAESGRVVGQQQSFSPSGTPVGENTAPQQQQPAQPAPQQQQPSQTAQPAPQQQQQQQPSPQQQPAQPAPQQQQQPTPQQQPAQQQMNNADIMGAVNGQEVPAQNANGTSGVQTAQQRTDNFGANQQQEGINNQPQQQPQNTQGTNPINAAGYSQAYSMGAAAALNYLTQGALGNNSFNADGTYGSRNVELSDNTMRVLNNILGENNSRMTDELGRQSRSMGDSIRNDMRNSANQSYNDMLKSNSSIRNDMAQGNSALSRDIKELRDSMQRDLEESGKFNGDEAGLREELNGLVEALKHAMDRKDDFNEEQDQAKMNSSMTNQGNTGKVKPPEQDDNGGRRGLFRRR